MLLVYIVHSIVVSTVLRAAESKNKIEVEKAIYDNQLRSLFIVLYMVAETGLEPVSPIGREILSLVCIPIPPLSHIMIVADQGVIYIRTFHQIALLQERTCGGLH